MEQVDDYPGASFKSYASAQEASDAFRKGTARSDRNDVGGLLPERPET